MAPFITDRIYALTPGIKPCKTNRNSKFVCLICFVEMYPQLILIVSDF